MNDKNIKDTKFKKGKSGNPNGRPKGSHNISYYLDKIADKKVSITDPITKKNGRKKIAEVIALKLVQLSMTGNLQAIRELIDRTEGKPLQKQELSGGLNIRIGLPNGDKADEYE